MIHISNLHNKRVGEPLPGCPLGTMTLAAVEALPTPWCSVYPSPDKCVSACSLQMLDIASYEPGKFCTYELPSMLDHSTTSLSC